MRLEGRSEVLIVGAGPTGCAAGIVLARAGVDVCVLDRARFPRDKVCGDAVSNDAVELIAQLGARTLVDGAPHAKVRRSAAVFPDGSRIERSYDRPGYIVPRYHLDDCLRRALQASGARLVQDARVAALTRDGARVTGAEGPDLRWSSRMVIAADGYGSVGLAALGQPSPRGRYLAVSCSAYYRGVRFPDGPDVSDHFFYAGLPLGYGSIFPAVDGASNVGVYLRADAYAKTGKKLSELMREFVALQADRLSGATASELRTWSLPIAPRPIPLSAPGLLLAGDAGGFVDPLSGEGIWQGLRTGMLAGEIAVEAVAAGELTPALQRRYAETCTHEIVRPSRGKAWVQTGIDLIVRRELYRLRAVRSALSFGYRRNALEMTKS